MTFEESAHPRGAGGQFVPKASGEAPVELAGTPDPETEIAAAAAQSRVKVASNQLNRALESGDEALVASRSAAYIAAVARRRFPDAAFAEIDTGSRPDRVLALLDSDLDEIPGSEDYLDSAADGEGDAHDVELHEVVCGIGAERTDTTDWVDGWGLSRRAIVFSAVDARHPEPGTVEHMKAADAQHRAALARAERAAQLAERERLSVAASSLKVVHPDAVAVTMRPGRDGLSFDAVVFADGRSETLRRIPDWSGFGYAVVPKVSFDQSPVDLDDLY